MDESLVRLYGRSFKSYVIYVTFVTLGLIFPGMTRFVRGDNTGRYCHPEGGVLWGRAFLNKKSRGSLPGLKHFLPSLRPDDPVDADFYFFLERLDGGFGFRDRKSTRLNSSHVKISYAVFCLKKKKNKDRA